MEITLLAIGKCKDKAILALCDEYRKRLNPHWPTTITELANKSGNMDAEKALLEKYLAKQKSSYALLALDEKGKQHSSRGFAGEIQKLEGEGLAQIIILIGGADGLHPAIKGQARLCLSLSKLTLPHMLVRPIIMEQLYRAATILAGHPYHRD